MKKPFIPLAIGIIAVLVLSKFAQSNQLVFKFSFYGLAVGFPSYKLLRNIWLFYISKKSTVLLGVITNYTKHDEKDLDDMTFDVEVAFQTPHGSKPYTIKSQIEHLPESGLIDVLYNENNPHNSILYTGFNKFENISLLILIIVFSLFFFLKMLPTDIHVSSEDNSFDTILFLTLQ